MAALEPRTLDFADTASAQAEGSAVIDGTPAEAWAVLVDNERWPEWFGGGVTSCRSTSDPAVGVGATRQVGLGPGGRVRFEERFIAWEEGRLWAFTAFAGPPGLLGLVERCTLAEAGPHRTRATYRMAFEPTALLRPAMPVLTGGIGRALTKGMQGLGREVTARR